VQTDLGAERLPANQRNFSTEAVRLRVRPRAGGSAEGIELRITAPGGVEVAATTDAGGIVSTDDAALAPLAGVDPIGSWTVEATGGPPLEEDGTLDLRRIDDLQLSFDYAFEYLPEAL
jgi:hypothetical protein